VSAHPNPNPSPNPNQVSAHREEDGKFVALLVRAPIF